MIHAFKTDEAELPIGAVPRPTQTPGSWSWNLKTNQLDWEPEIYLLFGLDPLSLEPSYQTYLELIPQAEREVVERQLELAIRDKEPLSFTHHLITPTGDIKLLYNWVKCEEEVLTLRTQDITSMARWQEGFAADSLFKRAFDDAPVGMAICSIEEAKLGSLHITNQALRKMLDQEGLTQRPLAKLLPANYQGRLLDTVYQLDNHREELKLQSDPELWVQVSVSIIKNAKGSALSGILHFTDITDQKRHFSQLRHMADHDFLTGLYNRRRFSEELNRFLAEQRRYNFEGAVMLLDLDKLKYLNDSLGHAEGDLFLTKLASSLKELLRESDVTARIGGDEFAVLLPHTNQEAAEQVAKKILVAVRSRLFHPELGATLSIGLVILGDEPLDGEEVLVRADLAMYEAKEAGGGRYMVYEPERVTQQQMRDKLYWTSAIKEAIREDDFLFHFQPILNLKTGRIAHYEALLRMRKDNRIIPPGAFIPIAERSMLMGEIDAWVIEHILPAAERLPSASTVMVNLSASSLGDELLKKSIRRELDRNCFRPDKLVIEITETVAISNMPEAQGFAEELLSWGCRLALDDFGAGFTSLSYLKHLPVSFLKIDQEFVRSLSSNRVDQEVVKSLAGLARGLGKETIAECVENKSVLEMLPGFGINYAQGFHIGRPREV